MTRILAGAAAVAVALLFAPSPSTAASFNCRLAALPVEMLVCHDGRLGALDEEMARQYYSLVNIAPPGAAIQIKAEQRAWIRGRNLCGYDRRCVRNAYRHRLQQLGQWEEMVSGAPGYGPFAGPPGGPPPGFYDDEEDYPPGLYDDEDDFPPGMYGGEDDEDIVPFEDPDDSPYSDDGY
jgi:uncharacterized protein YecT (DUF1311 family)